MEKAEEVAKVVEKDALKVKCKHDDHLNEAFLEQDAAPEREHHADLAREDPVLHQPSSVSSVAGHIGLLIVPQDTRLARLGTSFRKGASTLLGISRRLNRPFRHQLRSHSPTSRAA